MPTCQGEGQKASDLSEISPATASATSRRTKKKTKMRWIAAARRCFARSKLLRRALVEALRPWVGSEEADCAAPLDDPCLDDDDDDDDCEAKHGSDLERHEKKSGRVQDKLLDLYSAASACTQRQLEMVGDVPVADRASVDKFDVSSSAARDGTVHVPPPSC